MLTFLGVLLRVIIGFLLTSLAAGAVQVLFAVTPSELIDAGHEYWNQGGVWVLEAATILGIFAAPFAFLSAIISEWQGIRSFAYHGFVGIAVAVAGFALISTGESADAPSIVNSYAMAAFLTTGLVGGFVYWLFAGRFAYRPEPIEPIPVAPAKPARPPAPAAPPAVPPAAPSTTTATAAPSLRPAPGGPNPPAAPSVGKPATPAGKKPSDSEAKQPSGSVPNTKPKPGRTFDA